MSTPRVQYDYANGSANTVRPTSLTYPDGRVLGYGYGTAGGIDDAASRVQALIDDDLGATHVADYSYLGQQSFAVTDYTQPDVKWTLPDLSGTNDPDTGDIYSGLDRFGRVKDNRWYDYGASADADRIQYGYDRAGNRVWRENTVARSQSKQFDEQYAYDLIHRLKEMGRGTLNSGHTALTSETFAQCWSLDPTGNWQKFQQDDDGNGTWDLNQSRTANPVNEITGISETAGPAWATPAYNRAGNMTGVPQPADPTQSYTATYDAWNRLVKLADGAETVAEYAYDGAKRRIVQKSYSGGVLSETRHLYYTQPSQWQVVEERVGTSPDSAAAERQFVWGLRYIDDLVLRDRDTDGNGSLNERLYALQDANWNVTALVNTSGDVQERYAYTAYGVPLCLTPAFGSRAASLYGWETLYAGYRWETPSGLFHVRNRILHAALSIWLQRDPASHSDARSLYEYVGSSPLTFVDPTGMFSCDPLSLFGLLPPAMTDILQCVCGIASLIDLVPLFAPPLAASIDCICGFMSALELICLASTDPWNLVWSCAQFVLTGLDCFGDTFGCLLGGTMGVDLFGRELVSAIVSGVIGCVMGAALFDLVMTILISATTQGTVYPRHQLKACVRTLKRASKAMPGPMTPLPNLPIGGILQSSYQAGMTDGLLDLAHGLT